MPQYSATAPAPAEQQPRARVVLGIGGGIAAFKAATLSRLFTESGHRVIAMPTEAALEFVGAATWEALTGEPVSTSVFDRIPQVNHVAQGQAADLIVVAPATADLLARLAHGHADDLLTTTVLASRAPVLIAPAMHTEMWQHPATQRNVAQLRADGHTVLDPDSGRLTGADSGPGRLPEPEAIHRAALELLHAATGTAGGAVGPGVLNGVRVVITTGGTREALDPVRFLGNRSSGKQGVALARAARAAGADVHVIAAHVDTELPRDVRVSRVSSAEQLRAATLTATEDADVVIMAAAVADYRPAAVGEHKLKKSEDGTDPVLQLVRNPDILRELVTRRQRDPRHGGPAVIVGFAAETGDAEHSVLEFGRAKLERKGCDVLVVNEVGTEKGFGQDTTEATILSADGSAQRTVHGSKDELASALLEVVAERLDGAGQR